LSLDTEYWHTWTLFQVAKIVFCT